MANNQASADHLQSTAKPRFADGYLASDVYKSVAVPRPGESERLGFFIMPTSKRWSLYWRISDGDPADPDIVDYGWISHHKAEEHAKLKKSWLEREWGLSPDGGHG